MLFYLTFNPLKLINILLFVSVFVLGFFPKRSTSKIQIFESSKNREVSNKNSFDLRNREAVIDNKDLIQLKDIKSTIQDDVESAKEKEFENCSTKRKVESSVKKSSSSICFSSSAIQVETLNETKQKNCSRVTTV